LIIDIDASPDHWKVVVILRRVLVTVEVQFGFDHRLLRSGFSDSVKDVCAQTSGSCEYLAQAAGDRRCATGVRWVLFECRADAFGLFEFKNVRGDMIRSFSEMAGVSRPRHGCNALRA
jgi:hypothetical protein